MGHQELQTACVTTDKAQQFLTLWVLGESSNSLSHLSSQSIGNSKLTNSQQHAQIHCLYLFKLMTLAR